MSILTELKQLSDMTSADWIYVGKTLLVFVFFIMTFVVRIKLKLDEKVDPNNRINRKVERAKAQGHIITAKRIKLYRNCDVDQDKFRRETYSGKYEYELDGKKKTYNAYFRNDTPPIVLHLYYKDNPKKLFTNEEYHYVFFTAIPAIILNILPFVLSALLAGALGLAN